MTNNSTRAYRFLKIAKGYIYFRFPSGKLTALPGAKGSPEFDRAYEACLAERNSAPTPQARVSNGKDSGATDAAEAGVEGKALQGLGGWKTIQMAEHYTKTARANIANKKAIDLWNAELKRKEHEAEVAERRAQIHQVA